MLVQTLSKYKNWKPLPHSVIKDESLAKTIHEKGYAVLPFLDAKQVQDLKALYKREHSIKAENGAMFYTLYSKDHAYRKRIYTTIAEIAKPLFEKHFKDYKNIVNIFINKISGPDSGFYTHQDTTALDEFKHSPLSIWIPLQDITSENGALGLIEKSHWFFSPYRGISFPFPFSKINDTVKNYLKPIYLKAGEALIFDPRLVHNSFPNSSGSDRIVALCGIFPKDAEFTMCYKDPSSNKIELLKQEDDFILENESFFYDCHSRPKTGIKLKEVENDFPEMDAETFEKLCEMNHIKKLNTIEQKDAIHCNFIAEPDGINLPNTTQCEAGQGATWWNRIKHILKIEKV